MTWRRFASTLLLPAAALGLAALAAALPLSTAAAQAQAQAPASPWPQRTVTILVPFAAGSTPDLIARVLGDGLQARSGKTFVVENRPGASGNTATNAVAKSAPDGYTVGVSIVGPMVTNPLLMSTVPYDPARDLAPITVLSSQPSVLSVFPGLGVDSVAGLIDLLRKNPGAYNFGSIGRGSLSHLSMEALNIRAFGADSAAKPVHVVFPGSPAAATALVRGDVHMANLAAASVVPLAFDGKIKLLAVTSPKRSPFLPDLPTMAEAGVPGVEADAWNGLIAPAATDPRILTEILVASRAVLAEPRTAERLAPAFMVPVGGSPDDFRAVLAAERERWAPVIVANRIKVE